jgi:hypothetical protein
MSSRPKGERSAPSGSMFLGGRVDDALSSYHRHVLEHGAPLTLDQVHDCYRERWSAELAAEHDRLGVDWDDELSQKVALAMGLHAIELALVELAPHVGQPVAVQRRLEFALVPQLEWLSGVAEAASLTSLSLAGSASFAASFAALSAVRRERRPRRSGEALSGRACERWGGAVGSARQTSARCCLKRIGCFCGG